MSEIDTELPAQDVEMAPKSASLWPLAVVILLIVFVPTLLAWAVSAMSR